MKQQKQSQRSNLHVWLIWKPTARQKGKPLGSLKVSRLCHNFIHLNVKQKKRTVPGFYLFYSGHYAPTAVQRLQEGFTQQMKCVDSNHGEGPMFQQRWDQDAFCPKQTGSFQSETPTSCSWWCHTAPRLHVARRDLYYRSNGPQVRWDMRNVMRPRTGGRAGHFRKCACLAPTSQT